MGASVLAMEEVAPPKNSDSRPRWRKKRYAAPGLTLLVLLVLSLTAWSSRESIADDFIRDQLDAYGIEATYEIERIGRQTQILRNVVVGDPDRPDFTAEKVILQLQHRIGLPSVGSVELVAPRLFGTYRDGQLSFGSLDPIVFDDSGESTGLPDLNLSIRDGRGLMETDFGNVGLKLEGSGPLRDGFEGMLAANAPSFAVAGCDLSRATLFGGISTVSGAPAFDGPLRIEQLACADQGVSVANIASQLEVELEPSLADPKIAARFDTDAVTLPGVVAQSLSGNLRVQMRDADLAGSYTIAARGVANEQVMAALLTVDGDIRGRNGFSRLEIDSAVEGNGLRLGPSLIASVESLANTGEGTLVEPIARKIAAALQAQTRGSSLRGRVRVSRTDDALTLLVPEAEVRGGQGARLLSVSRFEASTQGDAPMRYSGNLATGGPGIPRISGRMERRTQSGPAFRLSMALYEAGVARLAIPSLSIVQSDRGALGFSGEVEASGPLPGGAIDSLSMPVSGRYEPGGNLALWRDCTRLAFRRVAFSNLNIEGPGLTLCPPPGKPILAYGAGGLQLAAGAPQLNVKGTLADTPISIASGPVAFAWPGVVKARDLDIVLGPDGTASRFAITDLDARLGDDIEGSFSDAEITLASVPLDIREARGAWSYSGGVFAIADAAFRLLDRAEPDRFEPLAAREASLALRDNLITAQADLREPESDRLVTAVDIDHNLGTGAGSARLVVDDLLFDDRLQFADLTPLALGVIANADGSIDGVGRIAWSADGDVTSSGEFSTDSLDFAAAFGPVKGASGTIRFTDLLNLTTAPGQKLRVASINPGVEVLDGEIEFALRNGEVLAIAGGSWPFMGGRLVLRDFDFNLGVEEERRYVFEIIGLEAAQFVAQMELENISATGTFDGTVPIVFDSDGNGRIDEGILISRPPGGNLSYVGDLTYEDLSAIANFAFDALRSMDYSQMRVVMEGPLAGEIVTRVRFDGVQQGEGAKRNIVTRQIAKLPIQFRINIRAQFYQLLTSMKALYDPSAVRDPRELGLLSDDGQRLLRRSITGEEAGPEIDPEDIIPDEPTIQDQESEDAR
ncbi:intermembrane phospholipid transport protein YdbH family protein [Qipengyuania intermedia]|uniref:intermembrane phospholipid transport protein YdbH family protein n=1 Tax=Qipengyuania intermedia TaxID=2867244 RepID=UPI001FFD50C0|nr:YdbH domain-containing protein [Qipengyuania intermedia]